jgi:hypothetical protein
LKNPAEYRVHENTANFTDVTFDAGNVLVVPTGDVAPVTSLKR